MQKLFFYHQLASLCPPLSEYTILADLVTQSIDPSIIPAGSAMAIQVKSSVSLGIPHGCSDFKIDYLKNKAIEISATFERIKQLPHVQFQYHLLKTCLSATPTSLLRQIRPSLTIPYLLNSFHDDSLQWLQCAVSPSIAIPHPPLNELSILIGATRCSQGGLNLPLDQKRIAPLAFLTTTLANCNTLKTIYASSNNKHLLLILIDELLREPVSPEEKLLTSLCPVKQDLLKGLELFNQVKEPTILYSLEYLSSVHNLSQSMASTALSKYNTDKIMALLDNDLDKSHFRSQMSQGAACVLMAPPTDNAFILTPAEFATLLSTRVFARRPDPIGYPTPEQYPTLFAQQSSFRCPFCSFKTAFLTYEHILVCPGGGSNIMRHNEGISLFRNLLTTVGVSHTLREPKSINHGTNKRTDVITFHNQQRRGYDWAVVSPNVPSYCRKASYEPFYAAQSKFQEKINKHFDAYQSESADFVPLILESTGAMHPRMVQEIRALVMLNNNNSHPIHHAYNISSAFQYWCHSFSIAAVRATMRKQVTACNRAHDIVTWHIHNPNTATIQTTPTTTTNTTMNMINNTAITYTATNNTSIMTNTISTIPLMPT